MRGCEKRRSIGYDRALLVSEEIGAPFERAKMCMAAVKHKKQMLDVRCQMLASERFTNI